MVELAFGTNAYTRFSLPEAVRRIAEHGYAGTELLADAPHAFVPAFDDADREALARDPEQVVGAAADQHLLGARPVALDHAHAAVHGEGLGRDPAQDGLQLPVRAELDEPVVVDLAGDRRPAEHLVVRTPETCVQELGVCARVLSQIEVADQDQQLIAVA